MKKTIGKVLSLLLAMLMLLSVFPITASANTYVTNATVGYNPYRWNHGTYTGYVNSSYLPDGQGTLYFANDDANIYQLHWLGNTYNAIYYVGGFSNGYHMGYGKKYYQNGVWLEGNYNGPVSNVYNNTEDKIIWSGTIYCNGYVYTNVKEIATSATTSYWDWVPSKYKVSYNANGGSGAPNSQTKTENTNLTLSSTKPNRTGYTFLNWNTKVDGSGTSYAPGGVYSSNSAATLYAQWSPNSYTVSYDANGGTGAPASQVKYADAEIRLSSQIPVREGYTFLGWAPKAAFASGKSILIPEYKSDLSTVYATPKYQPGDIYSGCSNLTLYAVWEGTEFIYYDANGGSNAPATQTFCEGETVKLSGSVPTYSGYIFEGWAVSADSTEVNYQPYDEYSGETITLYAIWSKREEGTYIISYDANGGTGGPDYQIKYEGQSITLSSDIPTRYGYQFRYWQKKALFGNIASGEYLPGSTYSKDSDLSLIAYWRYVGIASYNVETYIMDTGGEYELVSDEQFETNGLDVVTAEYTIEDGFDLNEELSVLSGTADAYNPLILKVYIDRNKHRITYDDGTVRLTDEYYFGTEIGNYYIPQKEGYTFLGWSEDGENVADIVTTMPDRDIEYTALWSVNSYSITLKYGEVNDNAVYKTVTQDFGTPLDEITDPEFEGYTFLGWDVEIPTTMPAENLIINALWSVNEYRITYKLDGVEYFATPYDSAVDTIVYGSEVTVRPAAVKEGYAVSGWAFTPALVDGRMPASDVVANATSTKNSYNLTVTYEMSDGKDELAPEAYSQAVEYGKDYSVASPEVTGHTPDAAAVEGTMGASDVAVTVKYSPNAHTVTWNVDGEKTTDDLVYGDEIVKPKNPEKEGYDFIGWSEDGETVVDVEETVPDRDVEYIAVFSINSYTITYNVDGEKYDEKTYEYNADVTKLATPEKQGYVFSGWDKDEPEKMPAENLVLNGSFSAATNTKYDVETYTMNLSGEYYKTSESFTGTTGETATAEYTVHEGFTLNADKSELEGVIAADGSLVLKVYIDRNRHNVSFNDGTSTSADELYYGDEIVKPEDPVKDGNDFLGWSEDGETVIDVAETVPDRDVEYIAVWSVNSYTITFKYGEVKDNAVYKTITEDFGTEIEKVADPEFEGYTFLGWDSQIPATMPAKDMTISALWAINEYKVTYKLDGAEYFATPYESAVDTFTYGSEVTVRPAAVKEGYTVSDWEFTTALVDGRMPAGDVVANATSSANSYKLTFTYGDVNSGAVYKEIEAEYGSEINAPANPEFSGFIFREWDAEIPATMPAENRTINALWDNGVFTVTYKLDDEDYPNAESASDAFLYGEPVTVREKAVKEGYTCSDWIFTPALEDGKMPASNVSANAISTVNSYTVTWIVNGSSTVDSFNFGAEIIRPEDPSIAGKVFKGWSGEIPATMPARNLVFVASFDAITHTATFVVPDNDGSYTDETGTYAVVKDVVFEEGQTTIAEPAVPEKDGYVGEWEDYTIGTEDIIIKAIYTITDTDNTGDIETEKTADVNGDGAVTITLNAFSDAKSILIDGENEPLDIVLVVDQSGSMAYKMGKDENAAVGQRRRDYLVNTATSFVNSVKQNAEETGADHRISIVGFASSTKPKEWSGDYIDYENSEVLTTVNDRPVSYPNAESTYKKSLMSVTDNYSHILAAINNIDAEGATAADLGFDMAAKVLSENASDRKKVIIFLTDGEPTATNIFDEGVANKAITSSKYLKEQGVTVYSIAISDKANPTDTTSNFNKFLHATSSNYKYASSIWHLDEGSNNGYFLTVRDENALQKIFENIYVRSVAKTLNFGAVTLYDTVKREFTMTVPQEKSFRENMIAKYGITNSDITVDRRDDGTTYIEARNITPYAYYDSTNVQQGWKADVSFDVTPNENAINAGDYLTNTDEAGVIVGGCTVATFISPTVTIDGNKCIVEFITGNETYEIREMNIGDEIVAPVCDYAAWTIPEGTKVSSRVAKYYADLGEKDKTVIWHIGDKTITQTYATGEIITPPEVNVADKVFTGWSPSTEAYMGYLDLEYTALFSEHTHNFKKVSSTGLCTESRKITYICSCGESYSETLPACEHKLETTVYETYSATITHIFCTECPYSEDNILTFKTANTGSYGWLGYGNSTVASFDLHNDVNGGEIHNLDENQYLYIRVPISSLTANCQNSLNQGKAINIIHYLANGGTEKCAYAVDGDYIIVKCTSFSYYVFTAEEIDESVTNETLDCLFDGHQFSYKYNNDATTEKDGTETEVCSHCGATGNTRTAEGTKLSSDSKYKLPANFREQSAAYKTIVTVNVTLNNVPSGAKVYIDGKEATINGNTYSADIGQVSSTKNIMIEVRQGTKALDSATLTVKVDAGFFAKLISFFSNFLFNLFKWKQITINY